MKEVETAEGVSTAVEVGGTVIWVQAGGPRNTGKACC